MNVSDEFAAAQEIIQGLLYFVCVKRPDGARNSAIAHANIAYSVDEELLYEPFFADFGPLNLGKTYRYCLKTQALLAEAQKQGKKLFFYSGPHAHHKANAAVLVGVYQVLFLNRSAEDAHRPLQAYKPYVPFRDPSCGVSTFHLTVLDCLKGIQKARDVGFLDWGSGSSTWSLQEYEHYEQVENGDLNWILPGKFVAFSGPAARSNEIAGYRLHTPEDYWEYFKRKGVTTVVRLNKKVYERKRFTDGGFKHHELYFPDGSCPPDSILQRFLELVENEAGAIAVHCKAGLGRTGVLICCYLMKHFRFTAEEVIGYIRICRPGSVIGPQQNFLREMEARMWHEGDLARAQQGRSAPPSQDLHVAGRAAGNASETSAYPMYQARGAAGAVARLSAASNQSNGTDLSLMQYSQQQQMHVLHGLGPSTPGSAPAAAAAAASPMSSSVTGAAALAARNRYGHRSITPLRYGATSSASPSSGMVSNLNIAMSHPAPLSAARPAHGFVSQSMPSMPSQGSSMPGRAPSVDRTKGKSAGTSMSALTSTLHTDTLQSAERPRTQLPERNSQSADMAASNKHGLWKSSTPAVYASPAPMAHGRSPSVGRSAMGGGRSNSNSLIGAFPAQGYLVSGAANNSTSSVARVLAPNGQPRKVPKALLSQYQSAKPDPPAAPKVSPGLRYGLSSK